MVFGSAPLLFLLGCSHINIALTTAMGPPPRTLSPAVASTIADLQDIIGTDAGGRGMAALVVPGDLVDAASVIAGFHETNRVVVILSGFPCCVDEDPPTETDGPPGAFAIARAVAALGHQAIVVTDDCNREVFQAALDGLAGPKDDDSGPISLETFPSVLDAKEEARLEELKERCDAVIACERAGPSADGNCYTMRGINMNERGLIAPIHRIATERGEHVPFIAIGDGGNELGMGKVIDHIRDNPKIKDGDKIGCVIVANYLVAASVSNWGGYALAAAIAVAKARGNGAGALVAKCLPTRDEEIALLNRCVAKGCRDGVSGKVEATVDGMPLETSLKCLDDIRKAATGEDTS